MELILENTKGMVSDVFKFFAEAKVFDFLLLPTPPL